MTVFSSGKPRLHLKYSLIFFTSFVFISFINSEFDIIYCTKLKYRCVLLSWRSGPTSKKESASVTKKTNTYFYPHKKFSHTLSIVSLVTYYYYLISKNSTDILQCICTQILYEIKMLWRIFGASWPLFWAGFPNSFSSSFFCILHLYTFRNVRAFFKQLYL